MKTNTMPPFGRSSNLSILFDISISFVGDMQSLSLVLFSLSLLLSSTNIVVVLVVVVVIVGVAASVDLTLAHCPCHESPVVTQYDIQFGALRHQVSPFFVVDEWRAYIQVVRAVSYCDNGPRNMN